MYKLQKHYENITSCGRTSTAWVYPLASVLTPSSLSLRKILVYWPFPSRFSVHPLSFTGRWGSRCLPFLLSCSPPFSASTQPALTFRSCKCFPYRNLWLIYSFRWALSPFLSHFAGSFRRFLAEYKKWCCFSSDLCQSWTRPNWFPIVHSQWNLWFSPAKMISWSIHFSSTSC